MTTATDHCATCQRPLRSGACLHCAMADALGALAEACADSEKASALSPETRAALPRSGFAAFAPAPVPGRFAHFEVRREIAAGGMGTVYEAEDTRLARTVALKMIRAFHFSTAEEKARFTAEAGAAAALDHPQIVPIYDVGEEGGQPYFTMKLIEGSTLAARLKDGTMPAREAAELMAKVSRAVHHAHQRGVLHRDLKPGNILLDAQGAPYLTDFGLAKLADHDSGLTLTHAQLGTPQYMSPEQAAGHTREISTASDVWALGVMLYQMLSGRLPFAGESGAEIMRRIVDTEAPTLSATRLSSSATRHDRDLSTIVARCLEKEPARRLPSAEFLAEELDRWLRGEPIRSRCVAPAERVWKWVRRHPGRCAAIAVIVLSMLAGTTTSLVLWRQAVRARGAADEAAAEARQARDAEAENAYFATVGNALAARQRFDFGAARRLLAEIDPARRGLEWRLVAGLSRGDDTWQTGFGGSEPRALAIEPVSRRVVVLTADRRLHFLDPETGRTTPGPLVPPCPATLHDAKITRGFRDLRFAPDGRHFACTEGDAVLVVETATGRLVHARDDEAMDAVWLDANRLLHACGAQRNLDPGEDSAYLYDISSGQSTTLPPVQISGPLALSPDGTRLAWVKAGKSVEIRRLADGLDSAPETVIKTRVNQTVASIAFGADDTHVAVGWGFRRTAGIQVVKLPAGEVVFEHTQPCGAQLSVALCPDEPLLVVAAREPWLWTWRWLQPPAAPLSYDDGDQPANDTFPEGGPFAPPHRLLTRSGQGGRAGFLFGHEATARRVLFLPGTQSFLTASSDGTVRRWPLASAVPKRQRSDDIQTLHEWLHPVATPDGTRVLFVNRAGRTQLWDRRTDSRVLFPAGHDPLAALDDGRVVTREPATGRLSMWRIVDASAVEEWSEQGPPSHGGGFGRTVHAVLSRDQRRVAALLPGRFICVDLATRDAFGPRDQRMIYGTVPGQTIDLSPDGSQVAITGFIGRRARLYPSAPPWNNGPRSMRSVTPARPPGGSDSACAFSRDGTRLFVGNDDGWVRVYEVASAAELPAESWRAHTTEVTALALSEAGDIVASAAEDGIALWNSAAPGDQPRRERLRMVVGTARNWMQFAGGDTVLLHSAPGRALEAWEAPR